jgi:hypothetical protein
MEATFQEYSGALDCGDFVDSDEEYKIEKVTEDYRG